MDIFTWAIVLTIFICGTAGVETEVIVKHGIVYVVNGFCGGSTGENLEFFEDSATIIPKARE